MTILHDLIKFYQELPHYFVHELWRWANTLFFFTIIGAAYWFVLVRDRQTPVSLRSLTAYLYPKHLYTDPATRATYKAYFVDMLTSAPVLAVLPIAFAYTLSNHFNQTLVAHF